MKTAGTDFLEEILREFTEVLVLGKPITLGLPTAPELIKVRAHADIEMEDRGNAPGGPLRWAQVFYSLCLAATVKNTGTHTEEEWRILASVSNELCMKSAALCGYPMDAAAEVVKEKVKEEIEKTAAALSHTPS